MQPSAIPTAFYRDAFKKFHPQIIQRLSFDNICDVLRRENLISDDEYDKITGINAMRTRVRARMLVDFILSGNSEKLEKFVKVLDENSYGDLAHLINQFSLEAMKPGSHKIDQLLIKCGIPDYRRFYVEHPKEGELISEMNALFNENEGSNGAFLVVHGVPGIGKTYLAARAVRDNQLLLKRYPDGISWQSLYHLRNKELKELDDHLIDILLAMTINLNIDVRLPEGSEGQSGSAKLDLLLKYLREPLLQRKVLLVFDDAWDEEIVCRMLRHLPTKMLITTRNVALFDNCENPQRFQLNLVKDFEKEKEIMGSNIWDKLKADEGLLKTLGVM